MRASAQTNKYNKDNKMQTKNNSGKSTPFKRLLQGTKYSLVFAIALSVNVEINTNVTINTAGVLP